MEVMNKMKTQLPLLVIAGRPNVGKSTLFNRLTRSRRALAGNEPGITRDRIYGSAEWRGRSFRVVDTGGILPGDRDIIPAEIYRQAEQAMGEAAVIALVTDARQEVTAADLELAQRLRRWAKPLLLLVNKADSDRQEMEMGRFYRMGVTDIFAVSAEHGRGLDAALDWIVKAMPAAAPPAEEEAAAPARNETAEQDPEAAGRRPERFSIAIIGRPNAGKSTLLNQLLGEERAIVTPLPGTTRDAVDAEITHAGQNYRLIDTAGIRRKGKTRLMAEKLSVVMARKHLEQADLALLMTDMAVGVESLDAVIDGYAVDAGCACVIVGNKSDLARGQGVSRSAFEDAAREHLKFLAWAPLVTISAQRGLGLSGLWKAAETALRSRYQRVPTARLNRFLAQLDWERVSMPASRKVKIYYLSQVGVAPPRFTLFVDRPRPLHFSAARYLENQLRREFGFEGSPLRLKLRQSGD